MKSEYKKKALSLHPDKNPEADPAEFVKVQKSYKFLLANKEMYDKVLLMAIGNETMVDIKDKVFVISDPDDVEVSESAITASCCQCHAAVNFSSSEANEESLAECESCSLIYLLSLN